MVNITSDLIHRPEFEEVRQAKKRIASIKGESQTVAIDTTTPHTFRMAARLSRDNRIGAHDINSHLLEVASLQRRIGHAGDVSSFCIKIWCR